jgi:hypothetical protein
MPGAAPVPNAGQIMNGNPNVNQIVSVAVNVEPPQPQNTPSQSVSTQLSVGNLPTNLQPTNVLQGAGPTQQGGNAGGDSLMAMMSRGQVIRGDSTYGQGGFIPQNGGASPQVASPAANVVQSVATGPASGVTYTANAPNISGM